jgi:hypothetical protein
MASKLEETRRCPTLESTSVGAIRKYIAAFLLYRAQGGKRFMVDGIVPAVWQNISECVKARRMFDT